MVVERHISIIVAVVVTKQHIGHTIVVKEQSEPAVALQFSSRWWVALCWWVLIKYIELLSMAVTELHKTIIVALTVIQVTAELCTQ